MLLHEFVIMPNHLHLLLTPAIEITLDKVVQFIKRGFSHRAGKELQVKFEIWQAGFTNHRIHHAADYEQHSAYIHENPVKARLVEQAEMLPYSSAFSGMVLDAAPSGLKPNVCGEAVNRDLCCCLVTSHERLRCSTHVGTRLLD